MGLSITILNHTLRISLLADRKHCITNSKSVLLYNIPIHLTLNFPYSHLPDIGFPGQNPASGNARTYTQTSPGIIKIVQARGPYEHTIQASRAAFHSPVLVLGNAR